MLLKSHLMLPKDLRFVTWHAQFDARCNFEVGPQANQSKPSMQRSRKTFCQQLPDQLSGWDPSSRIPLEVEPDCRLLETGTKRLSVPHKVRAMIPKPTANMPNRKTSTSPLTKPWNAMITSVNPTRCLSRARITLMRRGLTRQSGARKLALHFGHRTRCPSKFASSTATNSQYGHVIGPRVAIASVAGGLGASGRIQKDWLLAASCRRAAASASRLFDVANTGMLATKLCPQTQRISLPADSSGRARDREQFGHGTVSSGDPWFKRDSRMSRRFAEIKA